MPRDANGNYTLPAGNPVITGTPITTVWANPTMQDIANEITNSLSRDGEGGMLVPFQFVDGAVATPGITWTNETKTGFYRAGTNDMRVSVNGLDQYRWTATGAEVWTGTEWVSATQTIIKADNGGLPVNSIELATDVDYDTLIEPGFYYSPGVPTDPTAPPTGAGALLVQRAAISAYSQVYYSASNGVIFSRASTDLGVWSDWSNLGAFLKLSGGTMTGNISMDTTTDNKTLTGNTLDQGLLLATDGRSIFGSDSEVVQIRPNGLGSDLNQAVLDTLGNLTLTGDITAFRDGGRPRSLGSSVMAPTSFTAPLAEQYSSGESAMIRGNFQEGSGAGWPFTSNWWSGMKFPCGNSTYTPWLFHNLADLYMMNVKTDGTPNGTYKKVLTDANTIPPKAGTVNIVGGGTAVIPFGTAFPDQNYTVTANVVGEFLSGAAAPQISIKSSGGMNIYNSNSGTVDVNWMAVAYNN